VLSFRDFRVFDVVLVRVIPKLQVARMTSCSIMDVLWLNMEISRRLKKNLTMLSVSLWFCLNSRVDDGILSRNWIAKVAS
jgi:hypothetical protein